MKRLNQKGAVLIEFAFGIPVLVLMMYFCLDVPRVYQLINKLTTSAEVTANLILNVHSDTVNREITVSELKHVGRALEIYFLGNPKVSNVDFNISACLTCVTGTENGIKNNWFAIINVDASTHEVSVDINKRPSNFPQTKSSVISNSLENTSVKDLKINDGDTKLIIETFIWKNENTRGFNRAFYMLSLPMNFIDNKFAVISPPSDLITTEPPKDETIDEAQKEENSEKQEKTNDENSEKTIKNDTSSGTTNNE